VIGCLVALAPVAADAQRPGPGRVSATATLTVLAGTVQRVPAGATAAQPATSGTSLAVGDRVTTAAGATALVTFLDGSTVTVQPGSEVTVARADIAKTGVKIAVRITLGTVWARVRRLADPDSRLSLESNTATATVHDGLIGGQVGPDGTFVCWTQSPGMFLVDRGGLEMMRVEPGQRVTVKPGAAPAAQPFRVTLSALRINTPPGVLPLLFMPDGARVAGFVAPGVEVNQVFGSKTSRTAEGSHGIEVPAGLPGPYLLVLEGQRDGPDYVSWAVLAEGVPVHQASMAAIFSRGGRLTATITVTLDPSTAGDPRTARATGGTARPLTPLDGPLPGQILLAPTEVDAASTR
jgi:preprotein translocase subunit YajC